MALTELGKGVFVPVPTFFSPDEGIDNVTLKRHIYMLCEARVSGIIFLGSMGEAAHLTDYEREQFLSLGCAYAGDSNLPLKIIAGASAPSAGHTIKLCVDARNAGAGFALVLPPSFYRANMDDQAILEYFKRVADNSPIPIIIYNYPGVCQGLDISVDVLVELSKHKNVIGVKGTDGNIGKIGYLAQHTDPSEFALLAGSADFFLPALTVGAVGVIAGLANIMPRACIEIQQLFDKGEMEKARNLQVKLVRVDDAAARWYGVPGMKAAMDRANGYGGIPRCPLRMLTMPERMRVAEGRRVIFFYGSQTGTAEDYASRLAKECSQKYGVSCMAADIETYDLSYLDTVPEDYVVCFVMATYGEGEPTDNAVDFWELLTDESPQFSEMNEDKPLKNLRYLVFGLGSKTYEHYNAVGRTVDRCLAECGAKRIGERGEGDDDASMEEDFLAWQENMWPAFCEALGVDEKSLQSRPRQATFDVEELEAYDEDKLYLGELSERPKENMKIVYDAKRPYLSRITMRDIFKSSSRHCLHVNIDISDCNLSYQTGDHVAIWPTNNEVEVHRLASLLGLREKLDTAVMISALDSAASKQHPFPVPTTYRAIFRHYLDICAIPSRQTLMALTDYVPTEAFKTLLQKLAQDKDEYRIHVTDSVRNLGELLEWIATSNNEEVTLGMFASVPFDLIVENVSRLQPRYYSISSSSKESPNAITATIVTLDYQPDPTPERTVYGVNTNYLWQIYAKIYQADDGRSYPQYDLAGPRQSLVNDTIARIPVHVRRSQFRLPRNPNAPIVMVGPGTGVAPFRAFVRERALQKKEGKAVGTTLLFFGCRTSQEDFLYADEWPELFDTLGGESRMITAFSRETAQKVYVQHRLQQAGREVWELMEKGAYIYVCGDAKNMARDVNQTFVSFAQEFGLRSEEKAQEYVKNLRGTGRYQEDCWT
ncbi:NADPH-cytochrome P450 reductase [Apophysomyces sp. BC1034]|nr:NADPH-cytochrome P450 reductase [Apophysomyces sp. BC1015]KAG0184455.1 NADPH-cytochrome P450 reductase [Apophysomyces sp. BC1034]